MAPKQNNKQPKQAQKRPAPAAGPDPKPPKSNKRPKGEENTPDFFTVAAIGAPQNTRVRGITTAEAKLIFKAGTDKSKAVASVGDGTAVLEMCAGSVAPRANWVTACMDAYGHDGWSIKLGAKMRMTPPKAGLLRGAAPAPSDIDALMGCTRHGLSAGDPGSCTFIIRECAPSWTYEGLHEARDNATRLTGPQLAALFHEAQADDPEHPGFLTLRPNLWTHALGAVDVTEDIVRRIGGNVIQANMLDSPDPIVKAAVKSIHVVSLSSLNIRLDDGTLAHEFDLEQREGLYVGSARRVFDIATNPKADAADPRTVRVAVPPSAPEGPTLYDILSKIALAKGDRCEAEAWRRLQQYYQFVHVEGNDRADWAKGRRAGWPIHPMYRVLDALLHPSMHQSDYKSLIQKLFRFKPARVTGIPACMNVCRPEHVLALTIAVGVTKRGDCFNPDLAKYIRGQVAIMKRLAITIVEDGGALDLVPDLLALSLAASEVEGYNLPSWVVASVIAELTEHGIPDGGVIKWRADEWYAELDAKATLVLGEERTREGSFNFEDHEAFCPNVKRAWKWAAHMVDFLGAFPGDKVMMHSAADMIADNGGLHGFAPSVLVRCENLQVVAERAMPWMHYLDHHVTRELGFAVVSMESDNNREAAPAPEGGHGGGGGDVRGGTSGFEARHRQIWMSSSGYNPRTHPFAFDEDDQPLREVRAAQDLVLAARLTEVSPATRPYFDEEQRMTSVTYTINRGALAAGVGQIDKVTVKTTVEENRADGMANPEAMTTWHLVCCLGADSDTVVAMHRPTKHRGGNLKKPRLTATVERRAEATVRAMARRTGFTFKSAALPEYKRVCLHPDPEAENGEAWTLYMDDGDTSMTWSFESSDFEFTFDLASLPFPANWPRSVAEVFHSQQCALDAAMYDGIRYGMFKHAEQAVTRLVRELSLIQRRRLIGFLRQKYVAVQLPAPSLQGAMGSDETDRALPGDWCVARVLLLISRLVPAALQPNASITKFKVVEPNVLRVVEGWVHAVVFEPNDDDARITRRNARRWHRIGATVQETLDARDCALMDYQTDVITAMQTRDMETAVPVTGHFVALDVGMGKTLVGLMYLSTYLAETGCGDKILWFTDRAVVESHKQELGVKWGVPNVRIVKSAAELRALGHGVAIVPYTSLSSGSNRDELVEALVDAASKAVCCFDEVHLLYNSGVVRNAGAMRIALATPKFLMTTATPVGSKAQKLALTWLSLSASFEVNESNMMVASARMLAARVKLPFEEIEKVEYVQVPSHQAAASLQRARAGDWGGAARLARHAADSRLAMASVQLAIDDRLRYPDGGVFLVAENRAHAEWLLTYTQDAIRRLRCGFLSRLQGSDEEDDGVLADNDPNVGIVVGTLQRSVGYNLERLGHMTTGVYASNAASRYQIRGRIKRMTQKHKKLTFNVFIPKGTVLELLHDRQIANDAKASAIEQIGREWLLTQPDAPVEEDEEEEEAMEEDDEEDGGEEERRGEVPNESSDEEDM